ncbi:4Fe-4S single cluster domain-containing protein [Kocuria turfanensis]|uniref:4Fe-4S single cluster domain-containing protein n=1 Tax=Kocuria turfanensis TaxID=388357 RepID=UPI001E3C3841|nr:4Fe-4S single cluster domain-containing protein [Kocuria turfanensis]
MGEFLTSDTATLRVSHVVPVTEAEGPGRRFAVWIQGCSIRCRGCFNPHMWAKSGGRPAEALALVDEADRSDVEGITLLGGEPFEQAEGLAELAEAAQVRGLSVMTFTGYLREDLEARAARGDDAVRRLLGATDLLVDGPYDDALPDLTRPWVGSTNQRFHFLTPRYAHLRDRLGTCNDRLEVRVTAEGQVSVNGWATSDDLDTLLAGLGSRRRPPRSHNSRDGADPV